MPSFGRSRGLLRLVWVHAGRAAHCPRALAPALISLAELQQIKGPVFQSQQQPVGWGGI